MNNDERTRAFEIELFLDHGADAIWQALTVPEAITRWFPPIAEVTPGQGGRMLWKWEGVGQFETEIERWEPNRRLRLLEHKTDAAGHPVCHTMDFQISPHRTGSQLRLVHSGFGKDAEWDDEFAGISAGWTFELRVLRHYLDHHLGKPRHMALWSQKTPFGEAKSHAAVLGPEGFLKKGRIEGIGEGEPYQMITADGEDLSGKVLVNHPPTSFAGAVPILDHAIFRYETEGDAIFIALELWGGHEATARNFQEKWQPIIARLLT